MPRIASVSLSPTCIGELDAQTLVTGTQPAMGAMNSRKAMPDAATVAFIGTSVPRQCGIATYTADLVASLMNEYPKQKYLTLAVRGTEDDCAYPESVRFELRQRDVNCYLEAAKYLNEGAAELLCVQHEYGIFGGTGGSHILELVRALDIPTLTCLHTVLKNPNETQRRVLVELTRLSSRLIVLSRSAFFLLTNDYGVGRAKVDFIPHGIPDIPFANNERFKVMIGMAGRKLLLTFGLISPDKGIEYAIEALPSILREYPDVVYVVLGATHPNLKAREDEAYRSYLIELARENEVDSSISFHNEFVSSQNLIEYLAAADIVIAPYLNEEQIVSGTLAYAIGSGTPVIATPSWYAEELVSDKCGALVPFRDPAAIAEQVLHLLDNPAKRYELSEEAYRISRQMTWRNVARKYMTAFGSAHEHRRMVKQRICK